MKELLEENKKLKMFINLYNSHTSDNIFWDIISSLSEKDIEILMKILNDKIR